MFALVYDPAATAVVANEIVFTDLVKCPAVKVSAFSFPERVLLIVEICPLIVVMFPWIVVITLQFATSVHVKLPPPPPFV